MKHLMAICLLVTPLFASMAMADSAGPHDHHHDHHDHQGHGQQPHVHGLGRLNLVLEDDLLLVEFISPAINVLGFEHRPQSAGELGKLADVIAIFEGADGIIQPSGGACHRTELSLVEGLEPAQENGNTGPAHFDVVVTLTYQCARADRLKHIDITAFRHFAGLEKITVQWVVNNSQGQQTVTASDHRLRIL